MSQTAADPWAALRAELDRWAKAGRRADLWLRDDDAVAPTAALDRLIALTGAAQVPVLLAVIPRDTDAALAGRLRDAAHVSVAVHGWSHENHAAPPTKKQELAPGRPMPQLCAELGAGLAKLHSLHGPRLVPILVPPWNRIFPALVAELAHLGFRALSVFGPERVAGPIAELNTHVDLIDWRGTRGGRPAEVLSEEIAARLRQSFESGGSMGFLTHHLVHDAAAWAVLEGLFAATADHPGACWRPAADLL